MGTVIDRGIITEVGADAAPYYLVFHPDDLDEVVKALDKHIEGIVGTGVNYNKSRIMLEGDKYLFALSSLDRRSDRDIAFKFGFGETDCLTRAGIKFISAAASFSHAKNMKDVISLGKDMGMIDRSIGEQVQNLALKVTGIFSSLRPA